MAKKDPKLQGLMYVILGFLMVGGASWYLIFRLDFFEAPGLIKFFPKVYILLFAIILVGLFNIVAGIRAIKRSKN